VDPDPDADPVGSQTIRMIRKKRTAPDPKSIEEKILRKTDK
jgi:hypothetical protein